jgi:aminoglycoside phosphotransferase (APT) family kinase protein
LDDIRYEQRVAQTVHAAGMPVPASGDILQVNGHNWLTYERVESQNMWEILKIKPWMFSSLARLTAQLHARMHTIPVLSELPLQRGRLENKLHRAGALPELLKQDALAALSILPDGGSICHGDFHPGNILLKSKHAVVIDWIDATCGNPLADVTRTSIIALGAGVSSQVLFYPVKVLIRMFQAVYLRTYFKLHPGGEAEYRRWLPVIAAARLCENIPELKSWL